MWIPAAVDMAIQHEIKQSLQLAFPQIKELKVEVVNKVGVIRFLSDGIHTPQAVQGYIEHLKAIKANDGIRRPERA